MKYELELRTIAIEGIAFKLFVPSESSVRRVYEEQKEGKGTTAFPFWAKLWPSSLALSAFIQQHPQYIAGKEVLELAAGLGLPSLVAARYANRVVCSDYLSDAVEVVDQSIAIQGAANLTTRLLDWHHLPVDLVTDVLLLSDINYDPHEFEILYRVLIGFLQRNTLILLSTPQRLMAKPFIERLLPWCIRHKEMPVNCNGETVLISLLVLQVH